MKASTWMVASIDGQAYNVRLVGSGVRGIRIVWSDHHNSYLSVPDSHLFTSTEWNRLKGIVHPYPEIVQILSRSTYNRPNIKSEPTNPYAPISIPAYLIVTGSRSCPINLPDYPVLMERIRASYVGITPDTVRILGKSETDSLMGIRERGERTERPERKYRPIRGERTVWSSPKHPANRTLVYVSSFKNDDGTDRIRTLGDIIRSSVRNNFKYRPVRIPTMIEFAESVYNEFTLLLLQVLSHSPDTRICDIVKLRPNAHFRDATLISNPSGIVRLLVRRATWNVASVESPRGASILRHKAKRHDSYDRANNKRTQSGHRYDGSPTMPNIVIIEYSPIRGKDWTNDGIVRYANRKPYPDPAMIAERSDNYKCLLERIDKLTPAQRRIIGTRMGWIHGKDTRSVNSSTLARMIAKLAN